MTNLQYSVTDRSRGIGGSDVGAIFGVNKWMSLPRLWLLKTGRLAARPNYDSEFMEWGRYLEAPVAKKYSERTGRRIQSIKETIVHPQFPWMIGNPDRSQWDRLRARHERKGILEVKTAMFSKLREWSGEGVPASYYLQLQHYLCIAGLSWGSFAVLFGGNRLVKFDIPRDEALMALMIERERDFWRYVTEDTAPPMQLGAEWNEELVNFFPKPKQKEVLKLDSPEAQGKALRLLRLKEQIKARGNEEHELESWFKLQLADHAEARVAELAKVTWSPGERKSIDLDKLRAEYPAVAQDCQQTSPTRRFSLRALIDLPIEPEEEEQSDSALIVSARRIELD